MAVLFPSSVAYESRGGGGHDGGVCGGGGEATRFVSTRMREYVMYSVTGVKSSNGRRKTILEKPCRPFSHHRGSFCPDPVPTPPGAESLALGGKNACLGSKLDFSGHVKTENHFNFFFFFTFW